MRKPLLAACLWVLVFGGSASAEMCAVDAVPAATLLVPYFEVDISEYPSGLNTIVSINNAGPEPAVGHIVFWTDWALPVIDFDIYLTGFDVVTLDLFDVFVNGNLPITSHAVGDPDDTISPHGDPTWDEGSFPTCDVIMPFSGNPVLTGGFVDRTQNGHIGYEVPSGGCFGQRLGPGPCVDGLCPDGTIARGYLTIDMVNDCNLFFPNQPGYFETYPITRNALWGDVVYLDGNGGAAFMPLVHIEADPLFDSTSTPTGSTFYGRYTQGLGGIDRREPLATAWAARYLSGATAGTDWIVWRDPTANDATQSYPCDPGTGPDWNPLDETQVFCLDQMEDSVELCGGVGDPSCFPLATQRLTVDEGDLAVPFDAGWCRLNLNLPIPPISRAAVPGRPPAPPSVTQSYVAAIHRFGDGLYTGGLPAVALASACEELSEVILGPPLFADGFESGDVSRWGD